MDKVILFFLVVIIFAGIYVKTIPTRTSLLNQTTNISSTSSDISRSWNAITIDKLKVKFPPTWEIPKMSPSNFGEAAIIRNNEGSVDIGILSGWDKGSTRQKLTETYDSMIKHGAKEVSLGGSSGVMVIMDDENIMLRTVYLANKDFSSQYSISITLKKDANFEKNSKTVDMILSTLELSD